MVNIAQRPPKADERRVPGHWKGDLLIGKRNQTAIGTLVERSSGFAMLVALPDGYKPEHVAPASTCSSATRTRPGSAAPTRTPTEAVFGAHGALGSTEDVADRAGVGIATVFRHFPTKDALIEAALLRHFDRLNQQATKLGAQDDPADALRQLLARIIDTGATKLTLASLVGARGEFPPDVRAAAEDLRRSMNVILERAKAAGVVHEDVTIDEVYVLIRGLAQATATMPPPPATLSAAINIIWRGIALHR